MIHTYASKLPGMQCQHFVHIDRRSHAPQDQSSPKQTPTIQTKHWCLTSFSALNFLLLLRQNVHTALQLFAMRLAVFLKVFSRQCLNLSFSFSLDPSCMNSPGIQQTKMIIIYPLYKTCIINQIQTDLPRTRSSMTCDSTDTTVVFPMRANAMDAADRMKSPARIA